MEGLNNTQKPGDSRYYEDHGLAHDGVFRCKECKRLNTIDTIQESGACVCGHRRMTEVTSLSGWEWLQIRLGVIDFPLRKEFLAEFPFSRLILRG